MESGSKETGALETVNRGTGDLEAVSRGTHDLEDGSRANHCDFVDSCGAEPFDLVVICRESCYLKVSGTEPLILKFGTTETFVPVGWHWRTFRCHDGCCRSFCFGDRRCGALCLGDESRWDG